MRANRGKRAARGRELGLCTYPGASRTARWRPVPAARLAVPAWLQGSEHFGFLTMRPTGTLAPRVAAGSKECAMTAKTNFRGSFTALVTPFKNGAVDEQAFRTLVDWQITEGTNGLVPVGTTGESPTLSHGEHKQVVEWCVDQADGRVPVVAGAGSNSTSEAVDLARHAEQAGADAVLVVTPYYNKPTQEGMYQHFKPSNA